jgi:hypothetical protein
MMSAVVNTGDAGMVWGGDGHGHLDTGSSTGAQGVVVARVQDPGHDISDRGAAWHFLGSSPSLAMDRQLDCP